MRQHRNKQVSAQKDEVRSWDWRQPVEQPDLRVPEAKKPVIPAAVKPKRDWREVGEQAVTLALMFLAGALWALAVVMIVKLFL